MANEAKGRQWRVGTWTMGSLLLASGFMIIVSQLCGAAWLDRIWLWWPLLAVILGIEIIMYLRMSGQPNPVIRYDLFSIVLIGGLGGLLLLFAGLQGTGLMNEIQDSLKSERRTIDIAPLEAKLGSEVKRIVLQADDVLGRPIRIDTTSSSAEVTVFGSCRTSIDGESEDASSLQLVGSRTVGETLYVSIHRPAESQGMGDSSAQCAATVVLPANMPVELATGWNKLSLPGNKLQSGWSRSRIAD